MRDGPLHSEQKIQVIGGRFGKRGSRFRKHAGQRSEGSPEQPAPYCRLHESNQTKGDNYSDDLFVFPESVAQN